MRNERNSTSFTWKARQGEQIQDSATIMLTHPIGGRQRDLLLLRFKYKEQFHLQMIISLLREWAISTSSTAILLQNKDRKQKDSFKMAMWSPPSSTTSKWSRSRTSTKRCSEKQRSSTKNSKKARPYLKISDQNRPILMRSFAIGSLVDHLRLSRHHPREVDSFFRRESSFERVLTGGVQSPPMGNQQALKTKSRWRS